MIVSVRRNGKIGYVEINNPPVNAIGLAVRQGLLKAVEWVADQKGMERVVLSGASQVFCAGGDAHEFDSAPQEPHLPDILQHIEASEIPWLAAAHGTALGGGVELMLACRYRVATPDAMIGLPEVILGVVPGAGGTQRLPRLIGLKAALDIIATGKAINARAAADIGFLHAVSNDPIAHASSVDLGVVLTISRVSEMAAPIEDTEALEAVAKTARKRMRNQTAPLIAIDLVRQTVNCTFTDGLRNERKAFLALRGSDQAKALRHIFFAERAARAPEWLHDTTPQPVSNAVVVGGGTMGAAIAYTLLSVGIRVSIIETDVDGVDRACANVNRIIQASLKRGIISKTQAKERADNFTATTDYAVGNQADLAIEAAYESMEVKKHVFQALERALPEHAILATNTSYLDLNEIAAALKIPARLVGLHFFAPAHIMKLLEIVRGENTSDIALATGFELARRLKKIPVLAGVCDGFIGNRILARYREAADMLLMDGTNPWELDEAMVEFGYAMGPYEAQDLSGLDIAYANRQRQKNVRDPNRRYISISDRMVEEGRLGKKTGVGWYRYPGGNGPVIDPLIEDLIVEEAYFAKVERRDFTDDEIQSRLLLAMINEASDILAEGIAQTAADIDLVTVHGYGFPRWRGGLMHYADCLGVKAIHEKLNALCKEDALIWKPSKFIAKCADLDCKVSDGRK